MRADRLTVLARAGVLPFQLDEDGVDESLRLHHRYLDLRRDRMRHNIWTRFKLTQTIRRHMEDNGFWELETPILYKSTPEGAREFVVPTSSHPGKFYALPQSPQTFKQLYAISGFERYYQIAKCFRDEATRADRTQEFTQLDIEMAFLEPDELFSLLEELWAKVWREVLGVELETPFRRMSWDEATLRYGSDKPDLRFGCEIADVTDALRGTEFKAFGGVIEGGGVVRGFAAPGALEFSRKDFDDLVEFAKTWGGKGVAWLQVTGGEIRSPIAKFLSQAELDGIVAAVGAADGDTIFLVADAEEAAVRVLGPLRLHLGERLGLIGDGWEFLWVTGFPMFEWLPDENRWKAAHNPFSAPAPEFLETFDADPAAARSCQYDLVLNGNEIGGGSIRNHRPEVQRRIFELLGISRGAGRAELLVPAARPVDGRAAARRHRLRARPAGDAAGRRRLAARGGRLPQGPGRGRPADRRAQRGLGGAADRGRAARRRAAVVRERGQTPFFLEAVRERRRHVRVLPGARPDRLVMRRVRLRRGLWRAGGQPQHGRGHQHPDQRFHAHARQLCTVR